MYTIKPDFSKFNGDFGDFSGDFGDSVNRLTPRNTMTFENSIGKQKYATVKQLLRHNHYLLLKLRYPVLGKSRNIRFRTVF